LLFFSLLIWMRAAVKSTWFHFKEVTSLTRQRDDN
jgi:hypothetical protein